MSTATTELLIGARDYIHEHGLARGAFENPDGSVCATGAMMAYCGIYGLIALHNKPGYIGAITLLNNQIPTDATFLDCGNAERNLFIYNDSHDQPAIEALFDRAIAESVRRDIDALESELEHNIPAAT